jgi:hypothetical protein
MREQAAITAGAKVICRGVMLVPSVMPLLC